MRTFSIHICTSAVPSSLSEYLSLANGSLSMLFFLQRLPYLWCWWLVKAARFTKTFQVGIINKRSFFFLYQSINNISINDLSVKHSVVSLRRVPLGPTQKNSEAKKKKQKKRTRPVLNWFQIISPGGQHSLEARSNPGNGKILHQWHYLALEDRRGSCPSSRCTNVRFELNVFKHIKASNTSSSEENQTRVEALFEF